MIVCGIAALGLTNMDDAFGAHEVFFHTVVKRSLIVLVHASSDVLAVCYGQILARVLGSRKESSCASRTSQPQFLTPSHLPSKPPALLNQTS